MRSKPTEQPAEIIDLAADARALLEATAHLTGKNVVKARHRLALALKNEAAIAEALADASTDMAGDMAGDMFETLRDRIAVVLDRGKEVYEHAHDDVVNRTKAVDHTVRENPYKSMGIALGVGAICGFVMSCHHGHNGH